MPTLSSTATLRSFAFITEQSPVSDFRFLRHASRPIMLKFGGEERERGGEGGFRY